MIRNESDSENIHLAGVDVQFGAIAGGIDGLRENHFPADAIGKGQLGRHVPLVLPVPEQAFLTLLGIWCC